MDFYDTQLTREFSTVRDYIRWSYSCFNQHDLFYGHGTDNPWDEAVALVLQAVNLPWNVEPSMLDARLSEQEKLRILQFLQQRVVKRIPLPYITGQASYMGMTFIVDSRVLIPRSPIAELTLQEFQPWINEKEILSILDMCCGSGCIGIGCAHVFLDAQVDLSDISKDAIEVANSNIVRHQVGQRVQAYQSDLFNKFTNKRYDLIVTNPPYVDSKDFLSMPKEYQHEPKLALTSGEDGLDLTRKILQQAADHLNPEGLLVVEVGNSSDQLMEAFPHVEFIWPEFEQGGHGVFLLTKEQLDEYRPLFDKV